jgi:oligopeptide/dipeptide ABC transporter ATP-binding protein
MNTQESLLVQAERLSIGTPENVIDRDLSFTIAKGQSMGILGESGCGKSTLLKSFLSLNDYPISPLGGSIFFEGRDLLTLNRQELRQIGGLDIAMVFQTPGMSFDPITKIKDQFFEAMKCHNKNSKRSESFSLAKSLLNELRFEDPERVLHSYPFELSGGMSQRAALVMALLNSPKLILADEITSALDVFSRRQVVKTTLRIREKFGVALLLVTHDVSVVQGLTDTLAVMHAGRFVEWGTTNEVLTRPAHPYTIALFKAIPKVGRRETEIIFVPSSTIDETPSGCPLQLQCNYGQKICTLEAPIVIPLAESHFVRCHFPYQERAHYDHRGA